MLVGQWIAYLEGLLSIVFMKWLRLNYSLIIVRVELSA